MGGTPFPHLVRGRVADSLCSPVVPHVVNASPSSRPPSFTWLTQVCPPPTLCLSPPASVRRPPGTSSSSPRPTSSPRGQRKSVLSREVKMLAIATAALLALSATVEASISKYDYGGRESYKHEDYDLHGAYGSEYMRRYDHGHEAYEAEDYHFGPSYESRFSDRDYREPHHDGYDEGYSGDAYSEVYEVTPSYEQSHESRSTYKFKSKRSA